MSGMPSMRVLDYTERGASSVQRKEEPPQPDMTQYITRDELESILAERLKRPQRPQKTKEDSENA